MKIAYRDIESFVKAPDTKARVILIYGPDNGLMQTRAKSIGKSIVEDINDPFNAVTLSTETITEDPARLNDEANAISMMGGNRLIRIENPNDKLTTHLKTYLENPSETALIVLQASELGPRSSLRKLCETAKNAAAIPCYIADERDTSRVIRETLQAQSRSIEPDAVMWLAANIGGDHQKTLNELEKLAIYKGEDSGPINLRDAQNACGESGSSGLDDLIYAVAGHQPEDALKTLSKLMEEGIAFIVALRSLQNHFRRLHITKSKIETGEPIEKAIKSLAPPIFFKQEAAFKTQLNRWSLNGINRVLERLNDLEAQCKQTNAPIETLCAQAVLSISANKKAA